MSLTYYYFFFVESDDSKDLSVGELEDRKDTTSAVKKELLDWTQIQLKGYPEIVIVDLTDSFKDGKALQALLHSLKGQGTPDEFMTSIKNRSPLDLNTEAVKIADERFEIPQLVDPVDITEKPEELSMMTYLSYFRDWKTEHPVS